MARSTSPFISPCCLGFAGDLNVASAEWRVAAKFKDFTSFASPDHYLAQALAAAAIAWSPDRARPPLHADYPTEVVNGRLHVRPLIVARWRRQMIVPNVVRDAARIRKLCALGFDAGLSDPFTHIPIGERRLDAALNKLQVKHAFQLYPGDHNSGVPKRITATMLPFLAGAFARCGGRK
jgi:hypothetical protein